MRHKDVAAKFGVTTRTLRYWRKNGVPKFRCDSVGNKLILRSERQGSPVLTEETSRHQIKCNLTTPGLFTEYLKKAFPGFDDSFSRG